MFRNKLTNALLIVLGAASLTAACVPDSSDAPIRILGAVEPPVVAPGDACPFGSGVKLLRGSMDVSNPTFVMDFSIESNLTAATATTSGTLTDPNDFILEELVLSYATNPNKSIKPTTIKVYDVIRAGSAGALRLNLISPEAGDQLSAAVAPGDEVDLDVTFQIRGRLGSGGSGASNEITYPIRTFNSGFTFACPAGVRNNGPCGGVGGQNGAPLQCCPTAAEIDGGTAAPSGCGT